MTQNTHVDLLSNRLNLVGMVCALFMLNPCAHAEEASLTFGIFPYLSQQQLVGYFNPLRDYLQQVSGRKIAMITAPDYRSFRERTRTGAYDIILTAPHFARLAEKESGFKRVAITRYHVQGVILVAQDSPVRQLSDLRGKSLAVTPATSLIHMLAMELFRHHGLQPGRDFKVNDQENFQNTMASTLRGDSDACATGIAAWNSYDRKNSLRVIAKTAEASGLMIMAHPRVPGAVLASLRKALFSFGETAERKAYFAATNHGAWLPVDDASMRALDPYMSHAGD